jgi:hypothetical protein
MFEIQVSDCFLFVSKQCILVESDLFQKTENKTPKVICLKIKKRKTKHLPKIKKNNK